MSPRRDRAILVLVMLTALTGLAGCGEQQIKGSLGTVYPLEFQAIRARLYSSMLSIEYVQLDGSVPVRLTVDRDAISAGPAVELLGNGDLTGRTSEGREIPRFDEGDVRFDSFDLAADAIASGDFRATFKVTETDTLALYGRFSAPIEVVPDPGPPPPAPAPSDP